MKRLTSPRYVVASPLHNPQTRGARMLAEACRVEAYRPAHRVSAAQRQVRRQLRVRDLLVRARGRTISLMRALVRSEGLRVRAGDADRFGTYVQELTLPELAAALRPLLAVWAQLTEHLAVFVRVFQFVDGSVDAWVVGGDPLCDVAGPDPLRGPAAAAAPAGTPTTA